MNSRELKNISHIVSATTNLFLFFTGYYVGEKNFFVAVITLSIYIILTRISSELAYRIDSKLIEERIRGEEKIQ